MKITIESTDTLTTVDGVPCRLWQGVTERGYPCCVFVTRLCVPESAGPAAAVQFDLELEETGFPRELLTLPLGEILMREAKRP